MSDPAAQQPTALPLVVRTVATDDPGALVDLLPREQNAAWIRGGDGIVGWGQAARFETSGAERFASAQAWWSGISAGAVVRDAVGLPGTGLIAFGSFGFADDPGDSALVVPEVVVGRRAGTSWITTISPAVIASPPIVGTADAPEDPREVVP